MFSFVCLFLDMTLKHQHIDDDAILINVKNNPKEKKHSPEAIVSHIIVKKFRRSPEANRLHNTLHR
jgi:hypothetical protein